ncbi:hypothetical protein [Streptomyces tricolor]|uniref:hypothetical protein n=1 Tax=Streptomyces tricolor TaxID=68277 RepID=UPI0036E8D049
MEPGKRKPKIAEYGRALESGLPPGGLAPAGWLAQHLRARRPGPRRRQVMPATRCAKTATIFLTGPHVAAVFIWSGG